MNVAIVTEGFEGTGYGHLTRCLSVSQAFGERKISPLYIANCDENGKSFAGNVNLLQLNWLNNSEKLLAIIKDFDAVIIDSYLAPPELYDKISKTAKKAAYIDDYLRIDYPPGTIINGTVGAEDLPYNKSNGIHEYLLGVDYMPVRKEFWDTESRENNNKEITDVLISFGGQDTLGLGLHTLDLLLGKYPGLNYHLIIGAADSTLNKNKGYGDNVNFYSMLSAKEMLELMLKCDLAVSAAGQTTYELARVGVPAIVIGIADNQKFNIKGWVKKGFLKKELWYNQPGLQEEIISQFNYLAQHRIYRSYCDGQGPRRICRELLD